MPPESFTASFTCPVAPSCRHWRSHAGIGGLLFGLLQREVADRLGVTESTVTNWELNGTTPALRFRPAVITQLAFDPGPAGSTLAEQLVTYRSARGLSREAAAQILGVDPGTLWRWESGRRAPGGAFLAHVETFLATLAKRPPTPA